MSKNMPDNIRTEIDKAAVLDSVVYSDRDWALKNTLGDELGEAFANANPELAEYEVIATNRTYGIDDKHLIAFALRDPVSKDIYVVYRGTGDGKWVDNGVGLVEESSFMQRKAAEFYDSVVEDALSHGAEMNRIIVTGHSKGGNLAQYVTMAAEHGSLVDKCYSIDGQGFSKAAKDAFRADLGDEEYASRIDAMYSINGQNDYVHDLGITIIPDERTFFVKDTGDTSNAALTWHEIGGILEGSGLRWDKTVGSDGNEIYNYDLEQGPVGELIRELSANMMALDVEELEDCAITIMYLAEVLLQKGYLEGTGDRTVATYEEITGCMNVGLPLILTTIRDSEHFNDVMALVGVDFDKDGWLVGVLMKSIMFDAEHFTEQDLIDYMALYRELESFAESRNMTVIQLSNYISEDPTRLIEIYASLDLGKKKVHEAALKLFSVGAVAKTVISIVFPGFNALVNFVAAAGIIYLAADYVVKNWDSICAKAGELVDYVKAEISEFFTKLGNAIEKGVNLWIGGVCAAAEKLITVGARVVNTVVDGAVGFWNAFKDATVKTVRTLLFVSQPILYTIASAVYRVVKEPVRINIPKLKDCVDRMNRLSSRVAAMDRRLDSLYYRLSRNNIEMENGLFTSIANMFNLLSADISVDEGASIKRRARSLSELFDGYKTTNEWVLANVPRRL